MAHLVLPQRLLQIIASRLVPYGMLDLSFSRLLPLLGNEGGPSSAATPILSVILLDRAEDQHTVYQQYACASGQVIICRRLMESLANALVWDYRSVSLDQPIIKHETESRMIPETGSTIRSLRDQSALDFSQF